MAYPYHIRVCAAGSERQMIALLTALRRNAALLMEDEEEGGAPQPTVQAQLDAIHQMAEEQGAPANGFLYDTICKTPFGGAETETASLTVEEPVKGVFTACFDYRSGEAFQPEDWVQLQRRADGILICAQYAAKTIASEKGRLLLAGGRAMDNWDCVVPCWFWLTHTYLCGQSPEDLVDELRGLRRQLEIEDEELTPAELITECEENLRLLGEAFADPEAMAAALAEARAAGDHSTEISILVDTAEAVLWDVVRIEKYMACLQCARETWEGRI